MDATSGQTREPSVGLRFRTSAGAFDEAAVDAWELKASRRALMNLKTLLHGEPMLDLLKEQISEADRYYASLVAASGGQYRECRVDISADGLTATEFMQWFAETVTMDSGVAALERVYPAHPEHYSNPPQPGIVEVIGGHVARLRMGLVDVADLPAAVSQLVDVSFPLKLPFTVTLEDGTLFAYVVHELRDTATGCDIILRVMWPAAAPDEFFDGHAEHFSIEFRHWLRAAAEARAKTASGVNS